tara:strand:- start:110 stop:238 length:129 start_codon:yes stop_codon:yes gene_type:complete
MAETINEAGKTKSTKNERPCPSGFYRKNGKCVQAGVGPEYKP